MLAPERGRLRRPGRFFAVSAHVAFPREGNMRRNCKREHESSRILKDGLMERGKGEAKGKQSHLSWDCLPFARERRRKGRALISLVCSSSQRNERKTSCSLVFRTKRDSLTEGCSLTASTRERVPILLEW